MRGGVVEERVEAGAIGTHDGDGALADCVRTGGGEVLGVDGESEEGEEREEGGEDQAHGGIVSPSILA